MRGFFELFEYVAKWAARNDLPLQLWRDDATGNWTATFELRDSEGWFRANVQLTSSNSNENARMIVPIGSLPPDRAWVDKVRKRLQAGIAHARQARAGRIDRQKVGAAA